MADAERHQRRDGEQRGNGLVGGRLRVRDRLPQKAARVVIPADALAVDKCLRGRLDPC
jgi:hypothetical protein